MVIFCIMNLASFLLCIVFAGIGYVAYPFILPTLVASDLVSEKSFSEDVEDKNLEDNSADVEEVDTEVAAVEEVPVEVVEPDTPIMDVEVKDIEEEDKAALEASSAIVMPEPVVIPEVVATPEPAPAPVEEEPVAATKLTDAQFGAVLKNSVSAGEVTEFKLDQVVDWQRAGSDVLSGVAYEVGLVIYNAKTIFGEEKLQAKALVKDGKVFKWLWPTTDTEMK
jgi:hypothetical protein